MAYLGPSFVIVLSLALVSCEDSFASSSGFADVGGSGSGGSAGAFCEPGLTSCDGECVDLQSDANHCRSCSRSCASDRVCDQGDCVLPGEDAGADDAGSDAG